VSDKEYIKQLEQENAKLRKRIEELELPLVIQATNMVDGTPFIFREGSLVKAVRASISLPGIFRPVEIENRFLVDGGVRDTLPIRPLRAAGADLVLAVNTTQSPEFNVLDLEELQIISCKVEIAYLRFPLRFLDPTSGGEGKADTVDISANGLGFVTNKSIAAGTPLEMWLDIPDQHEPLYTRGEVVWSSSQPEVRQRRMGVHLEKAELMGLARVLWLKQRSA